MTPHMSLTGTGQLVIAGRPVTMRLLLGTKEPLAMEFGDADL